MAWNEDNNRSFVNPYNFLSVYGKCKKDNNIKEIVKDRNLISGVINCTLTTKTPIFIPNTTNEHTLNIKVKEHKSYDFFSYEDLNKVNYKDVKEPVIPGSSIKGSIRTIYEALTNSCFSVIDDNRVLSKRMPDASTPGIIKKQGNKYILYNSEKFMAKYKECTKDPNNKFCKEDYSNGQKVFFIPGEKYTKNIGKYNSIKIANVVRDIIVERPQAQNNVYKEGYILLGGEIFNKHHFSIINAEANPKNCIKQLDSLDNLKKTVALYKDNLKKEDRKIEKEFNGYEEKIKWLEERGKDGDAIPVYYKEIGFDDKSIYLSPSCITREVYDNTIRKILNDMGDYNSCDDINKLCDACSLFGMIGQEANSSRIRFTDGRYKSDKYGIYDKSVTLQELATPKISSTEFYMESPREELKDAEIWTYDYAAKWSGYKKSEIKNFKPKLRGRKFYWHHKNVLLKKCIKPNKMNVTIRPVKKGVTFEFKVFFERITKEELNKLVWTLNLGDNNYESNYWHKIGMGKPLGLGSIKIVFNSIKKRTINLDLLDNVYKYDEIKVSTPKFNSETLKEVEIALNVDSIKETISYPIAKNKKGEETIFNWFIGNKCSSGGTGTKPKINKTLCKVNQINNPKLMLYYYEDYNNKGNNRFSHNSKKSF